MHLKKYYKIFPDLAAVNIVLVLLVAFLGMWIASCTSFEHLTTVGKEFPHAKECGKCHVEIFNEWSKSDHAKAFSNPQFRKSTNNYNFDKCLSCHAPEPITADSITMRATYHHEGITCVSCHFNQGKLSGPIAPTGKIAPHPIGVRPNFYKDSSMCGICHKSTFAEFESVDVKTKKICQDCHMAPIKRKVTQATGGISNLIVAFEDEVQQKRHDFNILNVVSSKNIISAEVVKSDTGHLIKIKNNLPHSLPTGDFGFRVLILEIISVEADGSHNLLVREELIKELKTSIQPLSERTWQLDISSDSKSLILHLFRRGYQQEPVLTLSDIEVSLP